MAKKTSRRKRCHECAELKTDVMKCGPRWYAGGSNCFHLEWSKEDDPLYLCEECEEEKHEEFRFCDDCGAMVETFYYGLGYLPDDYDGESICPECYEKKAIAK